MIKIYYQNVRGLRTKTRDFYLNVLTCEYDIIVLCETWLSLDISDSELFCDNYLVYRRDRQSSGFHNNKSGGGVLIAVSKRITSYRLPHLESKCEDIWVCINIHLNGKLERIRICCVYIPSPVQSHVIEHFFDSVLVADSSYKTLILGDFNMGGIHWDGSPGMPLSASINPNSKHELWLSDFINLHDLRQYNWVKNNKKRILDLVLSDVNVTGLRLCVAPLSNIDAYHPPLECELECDASQDNLNNKQEPRFKFFKADYTKILEELGGICWSDVFLKCSNVDSMVTTFYRIMNETITKYVPKSRSNIHKYPTWYSKCLINALREKNKYRKLYRKFKNPLDNISFHILKDRCAKLVCKNYKNYISSIESSLTSNPKLFWSFLKQKRSGTSSYPSSMSYDDEIASNRPEVCNLFASYFSSVYDSKTNNSPPSSSFTSSKPIKPTVPDNPNSINLNRIIFTKEVVERALKRLDPCKGAGSDGIPPVFASKCSEVVSEPLSIIFNYSLATGCFPSMWKKALIVPIFKAGSRSSIKNYRPVSILSVFGKIFESLIYPILCWHLKQVLIPQQHGFIKARSTASNLACFVSDVVDCMDRGSSVDAVYTDFSKAFDKVDHQILINKLYHSGITGELLDWCASYLVERFSEVVVDGFTSDVFMASSGVPQGSHLGPLFFNVFINDVQSCFLHSKIYLYADDLKVTKMIQNAVDSYLFQEDLDRFSNWCDVNKMKLNVDKCNFVHFSRKKSPYFRLYRLNGIILRELDVVKDLGVYVDNRLRFHVHIDKIAARSFKLLGFILRNCQDFKHYSSKISVFNSLIRSGLEYCSVIWSPFYEIHKKRLESVQKRFLWNLSFQSNMAKQLTSYRSRIEFFKLTTLESRRKILDNLFLYKICNGLIDCPCLLKKINYNIPYKLARKYRYLPFKAKGFRTKLGHFSVMNRIQSQFSQLTRSCKADIDMSYSLRRFRSALVQYCR